MAKATSVWCLDIGQVALKALKVRAVGEDLQVEAFEVIEHSKILSEPDADRKELIRRTMEQFLSRHELGDSKVAISVPGQSGFMRFVKLPPVDTKKIPDIVRYEAEQQIPFPIAEVHWRWQPFFDPSSPEMEVGIFAMKRSDVAEAMDQLAELGLPADVVQMAPLALCNFMTYDKQIAEDGATLLVDVGADKTDLVVSDGPRIWTRTVQIGGNSFTEALVRAFKLSFPKAEKLKRTAATSKYARQIFQAMRPVFADLVQEIQRSIGHYSSMHRESRFKRLIGMGNGFRLPGMQKYLEQNLNIPVVRIDSYNRLATAPSVPAAGFSEHVLSFPVAYGLAVQTLAEARVNTNLLPEELSRKRRWTCKRPWFVAAAALLLAAFALHAYRAFADRAMLERTPEKYSQVASVVKSLQGSQREYNALANQGEEEKTQIAEYVSLLGYRDYWPSVLAMVSDCLKAAGGEDQELMARYAQAGDDAARQAVLKQILAKDRKDRRMITVLGLTGTFVPDANAVALGAAGAPGAGPLIGGLHDLPERGSAATPGVAPGAPGKRGFKVTMIARTPFHGDITGEIIRVLRQQSEKVLASAQPAAPPTAPQAALPSVGFVNFGQLSNTLPYAKYAGSDKKRAPVSIGQRSGLGDGANKDVPVAEGLIPDPMFPNEDMSKDIVFEVQWILSVEGDGVPRFQQPAETQ